MENNQIHIEKRFASTINSIRLIEPIIYKVREYVNIPDSSIYNILIAVTEAVNNAIVHGNKCSEDKIVIFCVDASPGELIIKVTDQGDGFLPENVADPRNPENLLKASGRGVFIIKELTSFSSFVRTGTGTEVTLKFIF